jgi:hypothetical protein
MEDSLRQAEALNGSLGASSPISAAVNQTRQALGPQPGPSVTQQDFEASMQAAAHSINQPDLSLHNAAAAGLGAWLPALPMDFDIMARADSCLMDAIAGNSENGTEELNLAAHLAMRLAQFGIKTASRLKATLLTDAMQCLSLHGADTRGNFDNRHSCLSGLAARALLNQTWSALQDRKDIDRLSHALRRSSFRSKKGNRRDLDEPPDSSSSEDADFDITKRLEEQGLPFFDRPEHAAPGRMARLQKLANKSLDRNIPWLAPSSAADLLRSWIPAASQTFGLHEAAASKSLEKKSWESISHLCRHRLTWGHAHVALGALHHWAAHYYICELHELGQAHPLNFITRYDKIKVQRIMDDISLRASATNSREVSRQCGPFSSREDARLWTSHRLNRPEPTLLKELEGQNKEDWKVGDERRLTAAELTTLARTIASTTSAKHKASSPHQNASSRRRSRGREGDRRNRDSTHGADESRSGRAALHTSKTSNYVCLVHDPANGTRCQERGCNKHHLDTTKPELAARFSRAKTAAEAAKARNDPGGQAH